MTEEATTLIKYRIEKSHKTLEEANYLASGKMWNLAMNRLYYSCFYSVIDLLLCEGQNTKTHKGTHVQFHQHFILTKELPNELAYLFSTLFDARQEGDYKDFVQYEESDVLPVIPQTKDFIEQISFYISEHYLKNIDKIRNF